MYGRVSSKVENVQKKASIRSHIFFKLSRIFGLLPYGRDGLISGHWLAYSVFLVVMLFILSSIYKGLYVIYVEDGPLSDKLNKFAYVSQYVTETTYILSHLYNITVKREEINKVLQWYNRDKRGAHYPHLAIISTFWLIGGLSLFFLISAWSAPSSIMLVLFTGMSILFSTYILMIFCTFIGAVYCELNGLLHVAGNRKEMEFVFAQYSILSEIAATLNTRYNMIILTSVVKIVVNVNSYLYFLMSIVDYSHLTQETIISALLYSNNVAWQGFILFTLSDICGKLTKQSEDLYKKMFYSILKCPSLCSNKKIFVCTAQRNLIEISGYGFFFVNRSLISSVIVWTTTYLVIILQFKPFSP